MSKKAPSSARRKASASAEQSVRKKKKSAGRRAVGGSARRTSGEPPPPEPELSAYEQLERRSRDLERERARGGLGTAQPPEAETPLLHPKVRN